MESKLKTGVLVHGCNLSIENWRHVAWGDPPNELGRIPQGMLVAAQTNAEVIVFGTGASTKTFRLGDSKKTGQDLTEAEYSFEYLKLYYNKLNRFKALVPFVDDLGIENEKQAEQFMKRIVLDVNSMNTVEEIANAGRIFAKRGVEEVWLVSSPSHVVRCLRDACKIYHDDDAFVGFRNNIRAVPSITCYEGTEAGDVVVVEPPHRPDRHVVPTHRRIQRMLAMQKLDRDDLVCLIEEFDDLLQKYENKYFNS